MSVRFSCVGVDFHTVLCARVCSFLRGCGAPCCSANATEVMSAVKMLMKYVAYVEDKDFIKNLDRKLVPPLHTNCAIFLCVDVGFVIVLCARVCSF